MQSATNSGPDDNGLKFDWDDLSDNKMGRDKPFSHYIGNMDHLFTDNLNLCVNQNLVSGNSKLISNDSTDPPDDIPNDRMGSDRFCTVRKQCPIMKIIYHVVSSTLDGWRVVLL